MSFAFRTLWQHVFSSRRAGTLRTANTRGRLWLEVLEDRTVPSVNWINPAGGDWDTASNWLDYATMTNHVPGPTDDARITLKGITVTHTANVADSVASLGIYDGSSQQPLSHPAFILSGGSLSIAGDSYAGGNFTLAGGATLAESGTLTLAGPFTWNSAAIALSGTLRVNGGMAIDTSGFCQLNGGTLINAVAATTTGGYYLDAGNNAVINNLPGATWDLHNAGGFRAGTWGGTVPGSATFNNQGAFTQSSYAGGIAIGAQIFFNNSGTVDVKSGTLQLAGGVNTGSYLGETGTTLDLQGGTFTASSSINGDHVRIYGTVAGSYSANSTTAWWPGDVTFTGSVTSVGALSIDHAAVNFSPSAGPVTQTLPSLSIVDGGTLTGTDNFIVNGLFTWAAGAGGGSSTVSLAGTLTTNGVTNISSGGYVCILNGTTFDNAGTATQSGAAYMLAGNNAVINNLPGATWMLQNTGGIFVNSVYDPGNATFNNQGTLIQSSGSGWINVNTFNNDGLVDVKSGDLALSAGTHNGTFLGETGSTVTFSPSAGAVTQSLPSLSLVHGAELVGTDSFTVNGPFTWQNSSVGISGTLTANGATTITASVQDQTFLKGGTFNNAGTLTQSGDQYLAAGNNAIINNLNGATWTLQNARGITVNSVYNPGNATFNNPGTLIQSGGNYCWLNVNQQTNSGTVDIQPGTLAGFINQSAGATILDGGNYDGGMNIGGGSLQGSGNISEDITNSGQISPGASPTTTGIITVQRSYTQTSTGDLEIKIGGTTPGSGYDQLEVQQSITPGINLDGTLHVSLINGFAPQVGDTFTILKNDSSNSISGTFANLPEGATLIVGGNLLQVSYLGGSLGGDVTLTNEGPFNSTNLQQVVTQTATSGQAPAVTASASDTTSAQATANALAAIAAPVVNGSIVPVTMTLNLASGSYSDLTFSTLSNNVTLTVNAPDGSITIVGNSPALTVTGGNITIRNVTFTTATDAATILVTGGNLTLRNCVVQESTGFNDAAIAVTGGSVDLGTSSDPGGNTINVNGTGKLLMKTSGAVQASGDTFTVNGTTVYPPVVQPISAPLAPTAVKTAIAASASFSDRDVHDTHTALWSWGDNTSSPGSVTEAQGSGSVSGSHTYTSAGVYTLTLTVTDNLGTFGQSVFQYVVIYDPSAGFVTGGGWINSPAGAYVANPALTGKANFGFDSTYKKGASVPTGNTQFHFDLAKLDFHSTSYDWLVVAGAKAQFKGSGQINNAGNDAFMLTAIDGALPGGHGQDTFRIKIWDKVTGNIIYDNQMGTSDTGDPTTALGGGSIVIHSSNQLLNEAPLDGANLAPLTVQQLQPIEEEAIRLWVAVGADLASFRDVNLQIVDLPRSGLGLAAADTIWLDKDAAGHGWFIDPTPANSSEFRAGASEYLSPGHSNPAYGKVDLLTVVAHELGHVLGYEDSGTSGLMAEYLGTGMRRLPTLSEIGNQTAASPQALAAGGAWGLGSLTSSLQASAKDIDIPSPMPIMPGSGNVTGGLAGLDTAIVAGTVARLPQPEGPTLALVDRKNSGWIPLYPVARERTYSKRVLDAVFGDTEGKRLSTDFTDFTD